MITLEDVTNFFDDLPTPIFFYQVFEFVTTFGKDEGKNEPVDHEEYFRDDDIRKCRKDAIKYYNERADGFLMKEGYFLPFADPDKFIEGKNSAYSLTLSLIVHYTDDFEIEYALAGEDDDAMKEGRAHEAFILEHGRMPLLSEYPIPEISLYHEK